MSDLSTITTVSKAKSTIKELNEVKKKTSSELQAMIGLDANIIEEIISNVDMESSEIEKLSDEEIEKIFTIDGVPVKIELDLDESKRIEFLRDFLVYSKDIVKHSKGIDETIESMHGLLEEHEEEYNKLLDENGCMFNIMRKRIESMGDIKDVTNMNSVHSLIHSFDDVINLTPIHVYLGIVNPKNILKDYTNDAKSTEIYKKYLRVTRANHVKTDLLKLVNLGDILNGDKSDMTNIVIFTIIRYFASKSKFDKVTDVGFITILSLLYDGLSRDKIDNETRETFKVAYNSIVDIFTSL